jgi:hypothetical protein
MPTTTQAAARAPANDLDYLERLYYLGIAATHPDRPQGMAAFCLQSIRRMLLARGISCKTHHSIDLRCSRLWKPLIDALPYELELQSSPNRRWIWLCFKQPGNVLLAGSQTADQSLAAVQQLAGPVGETIHWIPGLQGPRGFQLPITPEIGGCLSTEVDGHWIGRWSAWGQPSIFFWLDREVIPHPSSKPVLALAISAGNPAITILRLEGGAPNQGSNA